MILRKWDKLFDANLVSTIAKASLIFGATSVLIACGGRSGDDAPPVYQGASADSVDTATLQRNASSAASESLSATMNSMVLTLNGSTALENLFTVPGVGVGSSSNPDGVFNDPSEPGPLVNPTFERRARTQTGGLFDSSIGLSGQATTTRNGNTITIDPDETAICLEQETTSQSNCEQLLADMTVRMDAASDKSGTIQYLFRGEVFQVVDYSPIAGSYETHLSGVHKMLTRLSEIDPLAESAPQTMTGILRFEAVVLNATSGSESGTMTISVKDAVKVIDSATGADISIAPSTLFKMTANAGANTASFEVGIGALAVASRVEDLAGNPLQKLAMQGMTAKATISQNGDVLTVSNVGLGNGPLVVTVDSMEAMRATLDTFGFTVNQNSNSITLNGDLNYSAAINNVLGFIDPSQSHNNAASYTVTAASDTKFTEVVDGLLRVVSGGPLTVSYDITEGVNSATGTVNVQQGQCIGENRSDAPVDLVNC